MIDVSQLEFAYTGSDFRLRVEEFSVVPGDHVAVIGASGSGKSTLLHLLAGILVPHAGMVTVNGRETTQLAESARRDFRIANIGLVFQEFELLEYLSVMDNILLPYRINASLRLTADVRERAKRFVAELDVADKLQRFPGQLSQGEKQRVAIARALVTEPTLLLADEPTGNLDPDHKQRVLDLMLRSATARNVTVVMVTHDHGLLDRFERVIDMSRFHDTADSLAADKVDSR